MDNLDEEAAQILTDLFPGIPSAQYDSNPPAMSPAMPPEWIIDEAFQPQVDPATSLDEIST